MRAPARDRRGAAFLLGFLVVALLVAGGLSYLASPHPDGLDSVALHGCQVVVVDGVQRLEGTCIAQNAQGSAVAGSPLAGYRLGGGNGTVGLAGIAGVLVTLATAGALFRLLRRRGPGSGS